MSPAPIKRTCGSSEPAKTNYQINGADGLAVIENRSFRTETVSLDKDSGYRTAASVRIDTNNLSGFCFTDFFHLLKVEGKWTGVSKIFYTHVAA